MAIGIGISTAKHKGGATWSSSTYYIKSGSTWYKRYKTSDTFTLSVSFDSGVTWEIIAVLDLTEPSVLIDTAHVYRHRIVNDEYRVDQTLTGTGYAGIKDTDWENIDTIEAWSSFYKTVLYGQDDLNFRVEQNTRSGLTLPDTINPVTGDALILPSVSSVTGNSVRVDLGTSYNPSASVFTVYAKVRSAGLSYWNPIFSSASSAFVGMIFGVGTSGKITAYAGAGFRDSTLSFTTGQWQEVIFRYTTGASGKIEIALDDSAFQQVYTGSLGADLITGDGQIKLCGNPNNSAGWNGAISEIKLFTSSKDWTTARSDEAQKYWIFTGNTFVPDIASSPLSGYWTGTVITSYGSMGHKQSLDYGFSLWQKSGSVDIHIPHKSDGTAYSITAGTEIPAGYTLTKEVAGDLTNHNLADSLIQKAWTGDKFSNLAQVTNAARYSDAFNTNSRHISELTQIYDYSKSLKELFSYTTVKTGESLAKILNYIGAEDYYKFVKYASNPILTGYFGSPVYVADNDYVFYYSDNTNILRATSTDGVTWTPDAVNNPVVTGGTLAMAWKEDSGWKMLFRYSGVFGLATSSDGITWTKYASNPVMSGGAVGQWDNADIDPWGIIKIGSTYYLWYNTIGVNPRKVGLATSTDLINWTKDANNPIFEGNRYCAGVFKYGDYYYLLVPKTDTYTFTPTIYAQRIELYRDTDPRFLPASREYLGIILHGKDNNNGDNWEWAYVDTPTVFTKTIERNTFVNDRMEMYYCSLDATTSPWAHGVAYGNLEFLSRLTIQEEPS